MQTTDREEREEREEEEKRVLTEIKGVRRWRFLLTVSWKGRVREREREREECRH
jgi:hypothetical protein